MAQGKTIRLTYKQYDLLLEALRYRVADAQQLRQQAEEKGWDGAVAVYNEDIEKVHALRDHIVDEYNNSKFVDCNDFAK